MKNLKLPLTQSAGYIYDASGQLIGRFFDDARLKPYEVNDLAETTVTALNTLIPGVEAYRTLSHSISKIETLVLGMDKETRELLDPHIEAAHKAKSELFTESKLITTILKLRQ